MEWNIVIIIGLIGTICGITFGYIGYSQGKKKENKEDGALGADIKYIMRRTDEVLLEQKDTNRNINCSWGVTYGRRRNRVQINS